MYTSSKNLIDEIEFKPYTKTVFRLKPDAAVNGTRSRWLCPYCRKIWKSSPLVNVSSSVPTNAGIAYYDEYKKRCKHCNSGVVIETVEPHVAFSYDIPCVSRDKLHSNNNPVIYDMMNIQNILIGTKTDDKDGHVVSVNGTIFQQRHIIAYWWNENTQTYDETYNTYIIKSRLICNLDTNQVYFIDGKEPKDKQFSYVIPKIYDRFCGCPDMYDYVWSILRKMMLETIFEKAYGYSLPSSIGNELFLSNSQLFYMMKFPVLSSYAFYQSAYDTSPVLFDILYFLSNDDRKLRPYITCRNFDEYKTMWDEYFSKTFCYDLEIAKVEPWFLIIGWQLGHLGFRDIKSVMTIYDAFKDFRHVTNSDARNMRISRLVWMIFMKRNHALNKLFKRLIKYHGEFTTVTMLLGECECNYHDWIYYQHQNLDFVVNNIDFETCDFSEPLSVILD